MRHSHYDAIITDTLTGETRVCRMNLEVDSTDPPIYWWAQGNFGCDCNRGDSFHHAANEEEIDYPCNGLRFRVSKLVFPDGTEQEIDEDLR